MYTSVSLDLIKSVQGHILHTDSFDIVCLFQSHVHLLFSVVSGIFLINCPLSGGHVACCLVKVGGHKGRSRVFVWVFMKLIFCSPLCYIDQYKNSGGCYAHTVCISKERACVRGECGGYAHV